jgi:hypothetical protein
MALQVAHKRRGRLLQEGQEGKRSASSVQLYNPQTIQMKPSTSPPPRPRNPTSSSSRSTIWVGYLGDAPTKTPNFDRLARVGVSAPVHDRDLLHRAVRVKHVV